VLGLAGAGDRADNRVAELESELAVRPLMVLAWLLRVQARIAFKCLMLDDVESEQ